MRRTARRLAALAVLLAAALVLFLVESLIPPLLPMAPYVKIGLANSIVLLVIVLFGARDAFLFVLAKNLLGALFGSDVYKRQWKNCTAPSHCSSCFCFGYTF